MDYLKKKIKIEDVGIPMESIESKRNFIEEANDTIYKESKTARGWMSWSISIFF